MAGFPDTNLDIEVQAAFGADLTADPGTWTFADLSDRVLADPVTIRRGCTAGGPNKQTSTATGLRLLNTDGWLTPHHAGSPWWPYVDAGTPIRVSVRHQPAIVDTFTRTVSNGWGTSDSGEVWNPATPSAYTVTGSQGQVSVPLNTARIVTLARTFRDVEVLFDASMPAVQTGAPSRVGPQLRRTTGSGFYLPLIEFGLSGAVSLRVRRHATLSSSVSVASTSAIGGLTYSAGTLLRARVRLEGSRIRMRVWLAAGAEPTVWHLDATDAGLPDAGDSVGFWAETTTSNTNVMPAVFTVDNISFTQIPAARIEGFITDITPEFLPQSDGSTWSAVAVEIGGVGSRLEKNEAPALSPMRRAVQASVTPFPTAQPIAYWPLEDADGALSGASAVAGVPPMTVAGPAVFGFSGGTPEDLYQAKYGTRPLVSVAAGARLTGTVPISAVSNQWSVTCLAQLYAPDVPGAGQIPIVEWSTPTGTWTRWRLLATTAGFVVRAYNENLTTQTDVITTSAVYSSLIAWEIDAVQNGANIDVTLFANSNPQGVGSAAGTMGPISKVALNPERWNTTASVTPKGLKFIVGHLRVYDSTTPTGVPYYYDSDQSSALTLVWALGAWFQEAAHRRVARLCAEEKVPCEIVGDPYATGITVLNSQRDGSFTELLDQATESESGGLLYEWGFGYRYLARTQRYNQPAALTIDMGTYRRAKDTEPGRVLVPQLESRAANAWTVKRNLGSEGTAAASSSYRQRRGTIGEEVTVDVLTDDVLNDHAVWRVWTRTGSRDATYPNIPLDLVANPGYIDAWLQCDIGSRVWRTNQPTVAGVNTIDQVIEGITETIGPRLWSVELDASPGAVWDVWTPGDPVLGWVNPPPSTLTVPVNATATTIQVTTLSPIKWTTDPAAYPVDIDLEGERVRLNNPPTGMSVYTFTGCTRSVNGISKSHAAGVSVELWTKTVVGL